MSVAAESVKPCCSCVLGERCLLFADSRSSLCYVSFRHVWLSAAEEVN